MGLPIPANSDDETEARWTGFHRELVSATRANLSFPTLTSWSSASDAMAWLRTKLPYRFNRRYPATSLWVAMPRGWGACGEAAAAIAAWAIAHRRAVEFCLETRPDIDDDYAHVVAVVDGQPFDVYAEAARPARRCAYRWAVA